jgi:hypothetical protein
VDSALRFYSESLAFELKQQFGPAMAIVTKGDLTLWLAGPMSSAAQALAGLRFCVRILRGMLLSCLRGSDSTIGADGGRLVNAILAAS